MTVTEKNSIHEVIRSRLNSRNVWSIQFRIFFSCPSPLKELKHYIIKTVILLVMYGCETWSLTLQEEHRLRVSENRVLRRIFGPKREEVAGGWRRAL
jgi:hypothetical protein